MITFISPFEITNVLTPDLNILVLIPTSFADATTVDINSTKTLLPNVLSWFPIKNNPAFSNGPTSLPRNHPDFPILCNWLFDNFILPEELFEKALRSFETCVLVNSNLCGKLFSSLELPVKVWKLL